MDDTMMRNKDLRIELLCKERDELRNEVEQLKTDLLNMEKGKEAVRDTKYYYKEQAEKARDERDKAKADVDRLKQEFLKCSQLVYERDTDNERLKNGLKEINERLSSVTSGNVSHKIRGIRQHCIALTDDGETGYTEHHPKFENK
jgi:uncharacterized protein (DUF3084 family)